MRDDDLTEAEDDDGDDDEAPQPTKKPAAKIRSEAMKPTSKATPKGKAKAKATAKATAKAKAKAAATAKAKAKAAAKAKSKSTRGAVDKDDEQPAKKAKTCKSAVEPEALPKLKVKGNAAPLKPTGSDKAGKKAETDRKARLSRKSVAYHKAVKAAREQGLSEEECKAAGKEAPHLKS